MKKEKFEIGDLLLITLKGNHSIVKIDDIDLDDTQCTYNFECLYGIYSQADGWVCNKEYNIIKKVDKSFVDEFFEERNLHKIGSKVYFDGEEDFIKAYDRYKDDYYLENFDEWVSSSDIEIELVNESTFKVGDLVKNDGNIYKIRADIDRDGDYRLVLVIGNFNNQRGYSSKEYLELATQEDIDSLQERFEFKIGEKVLCNGKETTIIAIDTDKNTSRLYKTEQEEWPYPHELKKLEEVESKKVETTFKVDDLVKPYDCEKTILKILSISGLDIKTDLIIGDSNINTYYKSCELLLATQEELDSLQEEFEFKIGDEVLYDGEIYVIETIDNSTNDYNYYLSKLGSWVDVSDIEYVKQKTETKKVKTTFKVGDLVKIKDDGDSILKVVGIISSININIELLIGKVDDEGSYESYDLELTTQEELNRFQQGYLFKIGDKVLYDDEIDFIKSIDINDDEQTYLLLNADDWVAEYDISPFTESEKSDEVVKVVESPKVESDKIEPTIKTTKKRILLGAC